MNTIKDSKDSIKKIKNLPGRPRGKKKKLDRCKEFYLNIADFKVLDDAILRKKCPTYFGKSLCIALQRVSAHSKFNPIRNVFLSSELSNQSGEDKPFMVESSKHLLVDTLKENLETSDAIVSSDKATSVLEDDPKSKSSLSEKDTSYSENSPNLSNNIVTELDVTKLKLTLKNLINHRSSATSGDDKLSCDHSGMTSPRLPVTAIASIEDEQKTAENNSQLQLERDSDYYFNRRENINKENDKLLHLTIEKTHVPRGSSDEADDKYSTTKHERDEHVQAFNTKDRLSPVNSSVSQTTNQFHGTSRNNCDLPILAEYSPDDVLVDSGESYTLPPLLTPENTTETSNEIPMTKTRDAENRETCPEGEAEFISRNYVECETYKVYVIETQDTELDGQLNLEAENDTKTNNNDNVIKDHENQTCESRTLDEYSEQVSVATTNDTVTDKTTEKNDKGLNTSNDEPNIPLKKHLKRGKKSSQVKWETVEVGCMHLNQHDGYDSDATMIYDEDDDRRANKVQKDTDLNPLKIKHTQQLLRLKSKIIQSTTEQERVNTSDTLECLESLYPSFRGENLEKSDDMSNKTSASDMEDSTPLITDRCDVNSVTMDTKTSGSNTENKTGDSHKPIYTMRIGFKKNNKRKKISNNRNRKGEHEAGCDTKPSVNTWDQAITSAETRENAKQDPRSRKNNNNKRKRGLSSPKKSRNANKRKHDSQDMVLKNINKLFPKPRRKRPKDEDDLPTILPPKRRRNGKSIVTADPMSDMDRIKHEFPHFNWLEKKYKDQGSVEMVASECNGKENGAIDVRNNLSKEEISTPEVATEGEINASNQQNNETVPVPVEVEVDVQPAIDININSPPKVVSESIIEKRPDDLALQNAVLNSQSVDKGNDNSGMSSEQDEEEPVLVIAEDDENIVTATTLSTDDSTSTDTISCSNAVSQSTPCTITDSATISKTVVENNLRTPCDKSNSATISKDMIEIDLRTCDSSERYNTNDSLPVNMSMASRRKDIECVQSIENTTDLSTTTLSVQNDTQSNIPHSSAIVNRNTVPTALSVSNHITPPLNITASVISKTTMIPASGVRSISSASVVNIRDNETPESTINSIETPSTNTTKNSTVDQIRSTVSKISCERSNITPEVPISRLVSMEPATKKLKIDENISRKAADFNNIPPLVPVSASSKQNKHNNYKAQLFDPEIEATYNDIKQLKRDLEIRNREVGQMMALLKEKEDTLRAMLLSTPLAQNKRSSPNSGINLTKKAIASNIVQTASNFPSICNKNNICGPSATNQQVEITKAPPPAHLGKTENVKEILKTLEANPINIPPDIQSCTPRLRPLSPPTRFKADTHKGPLPAAHTQMPFEVPGHLITMKTERSKSQGNDSTVRVDLNTTRALSAPVQDPHGISPINLQQSRRSVGIGNLGSPGISNNNQTSKVQPPNISSNIKFPMSSAQNNNPSRYQLLNVPSNIELPVSSAQNNNPNRYQNLNAPSSIELPVNSMQNNNPSRQHAVYGNSGQSINKPVLIQKPPLTQEHPKFNTENAIQQELNEALKRRQKLEQRPEQQQDYQQFKITKPQTGQNTGNMPRPATFQGSPDDINGREFNPKSTVQPVITTCIPVSTLSNRPSAYSKSKSDLPQPYPGELINALHKTTQHARMNNSSSVIPILSHAQLPHSVRLIGAETVPANNSRMNEHNRILTNSLYKKQQLQHLLSPVAVPGVRPQGVQRPPMIAIPSSCAPLFQQRGHIAGSKPFPSPVHVPVPVQVPIQGNQQVAVPLATRQMVTPQMISQSQVPRPQMIGQPQVPPAQVNSQSQMPSSRVTKLVQGHLTSQPNAPRQDNYKQTPRDIQEQDLTSGRSGQRQDSAAIQQEANIKAQHIFGSCIMCGKFSLYLCSTCQNIWYCSQQCQLTHWTTHQHECKYSTMT